MTNIRIHIVFMLIGIGFLSSSCQFFETEKISSDTFLEEEISSINWNDIDSYPVFKECETISQKAQNKSCFESTLIERLYSNLHTNPAIVKTDLDEEIWIDFTVNKKGTLAITAVKMDSILHRELPLLKDKIYASIDSIQPLAPAYKRGIPVRTTFRLPIEIKSE